jgi:outer membrane protein assembly factor BamB
MARSVAVRFAAKALGALAALATLALVAGCAGYKKPAPQPLDPLTPTLTATVAWSQRVEGIQFPLAVATPAGRFVVAGGDGTILALDADSGREVWRGSAGGKLSAGVGSDGRFAAVVTITGDLVVFDQGVLKWRKPLGVRVTTAPLVAGERVFVVAVDRSVQAFDAADGRKLWVLARAGDPLTLAQNGVLNAYKDTLLVGVGPRMVGVDPLKGVPRWDATVGSPRGSNEIERLADLVGPSVRVGDLVCARSFQAAVGCVNAERGTLLWSKNIGGTDAVAADDQTVFGADASDRITAWKVANGEVAWTTDKLLYRTLSAPAATAKSVVFGDQDGTIHWLTKDTGTAQLRMPTDGSAVIAQPVVVGSTMLVVTRKGGLFAFRAQ